MFGIQPAYTKTAACLSGLLLLFILLLFKGAGLDGYRLGRRVELGEGRVDRAMRLVAGIAFGLVRNELCRPRPIEPEETRVRSTPPTISASTATNPISSVQSGDPEAFLEKLSNSCRPVATSKKAWASWP